MWIRLIRIFINGFLGSNCSKDFLYFDRNEKLHQVIVQEVAHHTQLRKKIEGII